MIEARTSEDIPQEVYDEVNRVHISTIPIRMAKSIEDIILYAKVWSFNHSTSNLLETDSFRIFVYQEPKPYIEIDYLCIDEVNKIDSEIEFLKKEKKI
jgi:hypothetical protein